MKTTIVSIALLFAFTGIFAQNSKLDEVFSKFQGKDGITSIVLTGDLIKFASEMQDSGVSALNSITQVRIISLDHAAAQDIVAFENMVKEIPLSNFKELMVVKENQNNIRMLAKESQGRWSDFLLIVSGAKEHVIVNVQGSVSPKELKSLAKSMDVKGMACVNKLK
jgi:hypothetical protein